MRGPTSPTSERPAGAGFTLLELSLTLAVIGLIAALALPRVMPVRSTTDLRIRAYQVTALLRADRNAVARLGRPITTAVDLADRRLRSGHTGGLLVLPDDIKMGLDGGRGGLRFEPDGRSSGGLVVLARGPAAYGVRVDAVTGTVDVVEVRR